MPGVAFDGSATSQSTKSGHVTYEIWDYKKVQDRYCTSTDPDTGACTHWEPDKYDWVFTTSGSTGALITGNGVVSTSSNVYVNGRSAATVGDTVPDSWVASPPVPSNTATSEYRNVKPETSGNGTGRVTVGSSNVFVNGKPLAHAGSSVTTGLGTTTSISSGSSNVFVN
ncbi:PAAR domain-containing protein [Paenibacillus sp. CR_12]|uniref:PAAR domain-containing protein n=1 Tax=Paenibacillus sp. CR_12 TaxID=3055793 RepID=UPI0035C03C3F